MQPYMPVSQGAAGPYASALVNEIHTHFPAFLYTPERFNSVRDVMSYVQSRMSEQYDTFSNWRNYYRGAQPQQQQPPQQPPQHSRRHRQRTYHPAPEQQVQPVVDPLTQLFLQSLLQLPVTVAPAAVPAPAGTASAPTPVPASVANIWDPVPIIPTAAEVAAGSRTYAAPTALETPCAICQDTIAEGADVRKLSICNHFFHKSCIDTWFLRNVRCPVCRHDIRALR
jgi:hypothetical protein